MRTISLWQPWGSLIPGEFKRFETRSWKASENLMGELLAIHAAKRFDDEQKAITRNFCAAFSEVREALRPGGWQYPPLQAVLCVCRLVDCIPTELIRCDLSQMERAFGDYSNGRFAWKLEVVKVFDKPIHANGAQGIWNWSEGELYL